MHRLTSLLATILCGACLAAGCRAARCPCDPEYVEVYHQVVQSCRFPDPAAAVDPVFPDLDGPHPVEFYIAFALSQNPGIQAARKVVQARASRVPQAASLADPTIDATTWPFYPNTPQTASGRMRWDARISQEVPWIGKLDRRAQAAEAEVQQARAELAAAELQVIEQVKRAYYELYFVQQSIRITQTERQLLEDLVEIAEAIYTTGRTSQQDVLRAQVEAAVVANELVRLRQELASAQARLDRVLHISPSTRVRALDSLPPESIPRDLELLYVQAVAARPELHARLAELSRDQTLVELARLEYLPDVTLSFDWGEMTTNKAIAPTADGSDNLGLGFAFNAPIYRNRLEAGISEAQSQVVATARRYDSLRDATLERVADLFAQVQSQQEMLALYQTDILPRTRQALQVSIPAYQVGSVDFLQLLDNWRTVLRHEIAARRLEAQLRQSLAELERVIGGPLQAMPAMITVFPEGDSGDANLELLPPVVPIRPE